RARLGVKLLARGAPPDAGGGIRFGETPAARYCLSLGSALERGSGRSVKKFYTCLRLVAAALLSLAPATGHIAPAVAQSQPGIVIGVVDFDLIMKESKAGKSVKSQYDKQRSAFNADLK